jgi:hypothetical protein
VGRAAARRRAERPAEAAGLLGEALALWRGEPVPDAAGTDADRAAIARLTELRPAAAQASGSEVT